VAVSLSTVADMDAAVRTILARMELLSYGSVSRMGGRRSAESPGAPSGEAHPLHERFARLFAEAVDAEAMRTVLQLAEAELDAARRRRFVIETAETLDDLCARIVADGWGIEAEECARAMRTSASIVRRARLDAGRHPDTGGALPEKRGDAITWARDLDAAGLSIRQIASVVGMPQTTLYRALIAAR
jgi:hypothetical protein